MNTRNRVWRWFALLSVLAVVVAACGNGEPPATTQAPPGATSTTSGPGTTQPPSGPGTSPGFGDCDVNPTTCNSADRMAGGEVTWILSDNWQGWNFWRPEGGSVYLFQALQGISIEFGRFAPSGDWEWDLDGLAREPQIVTANPLTIEYQIHDDAVWHNMITGETHPVTADDVILSWYHNSGKAGCYDHEDGVNRCFGQTGYVASEDVVVHCGPPGPDGCAPRSTQRTQDVVSIEATDESGKTFRIQFPEDYAYPEWFAFLSALTYPAHIVEQSGFPNWKTNPAQMAGASAFFSRQVPYWSSGPYVMERGVLPNLAVMAPNPDYWGSAKATLDTLSKVVFIGSAGLASAVSNNDISGGSPASFTTDELALLRQIDNVHVSLGSGGAVWDHIDFNMTHPYTSDINLRKAIFTAIDRELIRERVYGVLEPPLRNNLFFPQSNPANYNDHIAGTGFGSGDIAAARAILTAGGYTWDGAGKLVAPDGTVVPDLRFGVTAGHPTRVPVIDQIISLVDDLGITIVQAPNPALGSMLADPSSWEIVIFGWSGSPLFTSSPAQLYNSASLSNFGKMNSAAADAAAAAVQSRTDIADSAVDANEVSRIVIQDEVYVLPLWDTLNMMFAQDSVANVRDNHFSSLRSMYNLGQWGVVSSN